MTMIEIAPEQTDAIWKANEKARVDKGKRHRYYKGNHDILRREEKTSDGRKKKNRVTNWCGYGVDLYVGALTAAPYGVSARNMDDDASAEAVKAGIEAYSDIRRRAALDTVDTENLRRMLAMGSAIELHEFLDEGVWITAHDPRNWVVIRDTGGDIAAAIYRAVIPAHTVNEGTLLGHPLEVMGIYDATTIRRYSRPVKDGTEGGAWNPMGAPVQHFYGAVPVVEWKLNDECASILSDDLIGQCDAYNEIDSAADDDITYNANALLAIIGYDAGWVKENAGWIQEMRMLPLAEDGDAKFLQKEDDVTRISDRLEKKRSAIHSALRVPDIEQITGATGDTSGIALKLKFMPMQNRADSMVNHIKAGMRERIALINAALSKASKTTIEDYELTIQFSLPVNRIEQWQYIGSLAGIVSHGKQLELLDDVDDPQRELEALEKEAASKPATKPDTEPATATETGSPDTAPAATQPNATPEQQAEIMDRAVEKTANDIRGIVAAAIEAIEQAALDQLINGGGLDRVVARS